MSQRTFSLVAGAVFGLVALAHVLRIVLGWSIVIQDVSVPMGKLDRCYRHGLSGV